MIYLEKVRIIVRTLKNNIALDLIIISTKIINHRANGSRVLIKYLSMDQRKIIGNFQKGKNTFTKEVKHVVTTVLDSVCSKV